MCYKDDVPIRVQIFLLSITVAIQLTNDFSGEKDYPIF